MERAVISWSGGKDSAMALFEILAKKELDPAWLMTTVTEGYDRVSIHGVRRELLRKQAGSIGLPLREVMIPVRTSNREYERIMGEEMERARGEGIKKVVFADLFLEDLRRYREDNLKKAGMEGVFPLWGRDSRCLAREFLSRGFKAKISCVDSQVMGKEFAGRDYDESLLKDLPGGVDPCGENGEFHSFVYDGPIFMRPVKLRTGEVVLREERFYYCDLLPA